LVAEDLTGEPKFEVTRAELIGLVEQALKARGAV
jgi:hypothetical protein